MSPGTISPPSLGTTEYIDVTITDKIYTYSTKWKITAFPSGTEYLNLKLSKTDQDIPTDAALLTEADDRQEEETSTEFTHSHKQAVWIHADKQAYATEADVTFVAITEEEPEPLYFLWDFGDGPEIKTTSRTFTKRYRLPDKYNVTVSVSDGLTSVISEVYPIVIQKAVQPNRLLYKPSVLLNSTVSFTCRINSGTDVSYHWKFGDGTERDGRVTEHHIFNRSGEYVVEVIISNLVSSASLTGHIFVVEESCLPPMVKNMGPNKIQLWRYQNVRLAVTFEAQIQCNISRGLVYRWTIYDTSGQPLLIPHTETDRQYIELPKFSLYYGTYKAIAKVQVVGNVVYSNYSVVIEVMLSHPVSVINEATNIFISRHSGTIITLDGRKSYDPDYPNNTLSYSWSCRPMNTKESKCFNRNILTTSAILQFPTNSLKSAIDLFQFTLTVHSGNRSSLSEMFITVTSKEVSNIHMSCKQCQGNSVNWNEQFSISAFDNECGFHPKNGTYYWKLYLVNASSKVNTEIPFFSSVDLGLPFRIKENLYLYQQTVTPFTEAPLTEPSVPVSPYLLSNTGFSAPITHNILTSVIHTKPHDIINTHSLIENPNMFKHPSFPPTTPSHPSFPLPFPEETESSGGQWEYQGFLPVSDSVSLTDVTSDYDYYGSGIEEAGGVPVGRPTEIDLMGFSWNGSYTLTHMTKGDNLVDPSLLGQVVSEKTLLDLHRQLIHQTVFESYTFTGISSSVVTFKPFMLQPKSLYMLEVSASCEGGQQGKSQLFFHTHAVPKGMSCQIQPSTGFEIHTHFSIFCSSGREDLVFEYSYSVGNGQRRLLYEGRDFQHYFNLPSGDPKHDYKVTVFVKIQNRLGAATKHSPVTVTVLPSFQKNSSSHLSPDQELYIYGIGNLTSLVRIGSDRDVINYIHLLSTVLKRLSLNQESSADLLTLTRSALISAICQLTITDQGLLCEIIHMLTDLIKISSQVMFDSANQVIQYVHNISSIKHESKATGHSLDIEVVNALVSLLSVVLDAPVLSFRPGHQLINKILYTINNLVLRYMLSSNVPQYNVSTTSMKALVWKVDHHSHTMVKPFDFTTFHLSDFLEMQFQQWSSNTKTSRALLSGSQSTDGAPTTGLNPPHSPLETQQIFVSTTAPLRKKSKCDTCSRRSPLSFRGKRREIRADMRRSVLRSQVNTHQFNITPKIQQRAIHITVRFSRPAERPFPILLLLRMYHRPTPKLYNEQKVYQWKGQTAHMFIPASSLHVAGSVYLMLLNADYNQSLSNKYIARAVNYTLNIESVECLSWDGVREWKSSGCFTHSGVSPDKINCSCNHLASFAVSHEKITSSYNSADVSQFNPSNANYTLIIVTVIFLILYVVMLAICRRADVSMQKTTGLFLLPENNPSDQFLYAVTIKTGFRSRTTMTAQVHIVLYGDDGVSQTRELSSLDSKLFTCNSRNTFILSTPESLGRVWKVHLWHNNGGSSPSWYLSHVVVRDLVQGSCWFFLGQCWLAVDEGDGKVERSLTSSKYGLTFKQLLYLKLTEYLSDFHPWLSVYSCPSYSAYTRVQRLSVCMLLLLGYMCVNTILIHIWEEQHFLDMGLIDVSPVSMVTGLCSVLAVMPVGSLVSLVFRVSKASISKHLSEEQYKVKVPDVYSVEDHHDALLMNDCTFEPNLSSRLPQRKEHKYGTQNQTACDSTSASKLQEDPDAIVEMVDKSGSDFNNRPHDLKRHQVCVGRIRRISNLQSCCHYLGWTLCISLSLMCIIITASLGIKYSRTKALLWIHSVFFSLVCCGFVLHPAMILIIAIIVSLIHRERPDWFHSLSVKGPVNELLRHGGLKTHNDLFNPNQQTQGKITHFQKVLAARQRARYLRLVRPPNPRELKTMRSQIKKRTFLHKTARDLMVHLIMLSLILFVTYGKSDNDLKYRLNHAITTHFTKGPHNSFHSIERQDDWWNWTASTFLEKLYHSHDKVDIEKMPLGAAYSLITTPVIRKIDSTSSQMLNLFGKNNIIYSQSESLNEDSVTSSNDQSVIERHSLCGQLGCYEGKGVSVNLGKTRSQAMKVIKKLQSTGWMIQFTRVVMIQFLLHNAPSNLFTSVTILVEQTPIRTLKTSATVQSTRLYHLPLALDYSIMACELLLLLTILLQMYWQIYVMTQRGWLYCRNPWNWLEVAVIICCLSRYACSVYHFMLKTEIIDFLQRMDFKLYVDLSPIFRCEKIFLSVHGIAVNLLLLKCVLFLRLNKTLAGAVSTLNQIFSSLLWLLAPGVVVTVAFSCLWNLILHSFPSTSNTGFVGLFFSRSSLIDHFMYYQTQSTLHFGLLLIPLKAMLIGNLAIIVKQTKRTTKRKDIMTFFELMSYMKNKALCFISKGSHKATYHHVHTNSLCFAEFEDLMDELLFHLCAMSDSLTLQAKQNVYETQSNFSFPISQHDCGSESADFDVTCASSQSNKFRKLKQRGSLDLRGVSSHIENTLRAPLQIASYIDRGATQESHSKGPKEYRSHLKEPHSSKQLNSAPAEWIGIMASNKRLSDPARIGDNHSSVEKSDSLTQIKRHTVQTTTSCEVITSQTTNTNSYQLNVLTIEGMVNYCVEEQTIIPGYIEQCM
nr:LOW QUALITY PROTEIN: polycystic kidney disease 1 like 1 [Misgurnus anguillicaudatus]